MSAVARRQRTWNSSALSVDWSSPVNWSHRLNDGLVAWCLVAPHQSYGLTLRNLVNPFRDFTANNMEQTDWNTPTGALRLGGWASVDLGGTDEFLRVSAAIVPDVPLTMSCWFRVPNVTADYNLIAMTQSGLPFDSQTLGAWGSSTSDRIVAESSTDAGAVSASSSTAYTANVWHHAVATFASTALRAAYLNGGSKGTEGSTKVVGTYNQTIIGAYAHGTGTYGAVLGQMDCVRIYNRALSDDEVLEEYELTRNYSAGLLNRRRRVTYFVPVATGIAFDVASNSGFQVADSDYVWDHTVGVGGNRFLRVEIEILGTPGTTVTSIKWDDDGIGGGAQVPLTRIGVGQSATGAGIVEAWGLIAPASGTKKIRAVLSGAVTSAGTAASYANVHQTSPYANFNSAQATNVGAADAEVTITTVATGSWVVNALATTDENVTAEQTARNEVNGVGVGSGANEDTNGSVSPGTTVGSYTDVGAGATWVIIGYELRPATAPTLGITITPSTLTLALSVFSPIVSTPRTCTPATKALTVSAFAPSVSIPRTIIPLTKALTLSAFAPTVSVPRLITPSTVSLVLAAFAPVIKETVTPTTLALNLSIFAPTVSAPRSMTPGTISFILSTFAPIISVPRVQTPSTKALILSAFAPTVITTPTIIPGTLSLTLSVFTPTISVPRVQTPSTLVLILSAFAPSVQTPKVITPSKLSLLLTTFAPTVDAEVSVTVIPPTLALVLTCFAPTITAVGYFTGAKRFSAKDRQGRFEVADREGRFTVGDRPSNFEVAP